MYITAQGPRLQNDLYCIEWDVKLYYTIPYHTGFCHTLVHLCCYYSEHWFFTDDKVQFMDVNSYVIREGLQRLIRSFYGLCPSHITIQFSCQVSWHQTCTCNKSLFPNVTKLRPPAVHTSTASGIRHDPVHPKCTDFSYQPLPKQIGVSKARECNCNRDLLFVWSGFSRVQVLRPF